MEIDCSGIKPFLVTHAWNASNTLADSIGASEAPAKMIPESIIDAVDYQIPLRHTGGSG